LLAPILAAAPEPVRMTVELVGRPGTPAAMPARGTVTLEATFARALSGQTVRHDPTMHTHTERERKRGLNARPHSGGGPPCTPVAQAFMRALHCPGGSGGRALARHGQRQSARFYECQPAQAGAAERHAGQRRRCHHAAPGHDAGCGRRCRRAGGTVHREHGRQYWVARTEHWVRHGPGHGVGDAEWMGQRRSRGRHLRQPGPQRRRGRRQAARPRPWHPK
jgi:hypothetical protein